MQQLGAETRLAVRLCVRGFPAFMMPRMGTASPLRPSPSRVGLLTSSRLRLPAHDTELMKRNALRASRWRGGGVIGRSCSQPLYGTARSGLSLLPLVTAAVLTSTEPL